MALILNPSSSFSSNKPNLQFHKSLYFKPFKFSIRCLQDSSGEEPTSNSGPSSRNPGDSPAGSGFGSSAAASTKKKKTKAKRERATIIRRTPLEKPTLPTPQEEHRKNENAFLLTWLGLGAIILVEGIALAASGFLPEAWDSFLVKYLYPSFTPTVFLFVAGTVGYGVLKYLQNENSNKEN